MEKPWMVYPIGILMFPLFSIWCHICYTHYMVSLYMMLIQWYPPWIYIYIHTYIYHIPMIFHIIPILSIHTFSIQWYQLSLYIPNIPIPPAPRSDDYQLRGPFGERQELRWRQRWLCAPRVGQRHVTRREELDEMGRNFTRENIHFASTKNIHLTNEKLGNNKKIRFSIKGSLGCQTWALPVGIIETWTVFPMMGDCSRVFVKNLWICSTKIRDLAFNSLKKGVHQQNVDFICVDEEIKSCLLKILRNKMLFCPKR